MNNAFDNYRKCVEELKLSEKRSKFTYLTPTLKTTALMTNLRHRFDSGILDTSCQDPFDVLYVRFFNKKYWLALDLVIIFEYDIPKPVIQSISSDYYSKAPERDAPNRITFTTFKKDKIGHWLSIDEERRAADIQISKDHILHLWNRPFVLEASTDYDKDFRKEWRDGYLEYEGNEYGDTSDFYIIGSVETVKAKNS